MKNDRSGRGSGLMLAVLLIAALIVAWLAVTQLRLFNPGASKGEPAARENPVTQARDAVDAVNDRLGQYLGGP